MTFVHLPFQFYFPDSIVCFDSIILILASFTVSKFADTCSPSSSLIHSFWPRYIFSCYILTYIHSSRCSLKPSQGTAKMHPLVTQHCMDFVFWLRDKLSPLLPQDFGNLLLTRIEMVNQVMQDIVRSPPSLARFLIQGWLLYAIHGVGRQLALDYDISANWSIRAWLCISFCF